jgi:hypothetical protein
LLFILFGFTALAAPNNPPAPNFRTPPPTPQVSIDENSLILLIVAFIFGLYFIYNNNIKTKTPTF